MKMKNEVGFAGRNCKGNSEDSKVKSVFGTGEWAAFNVNCVNGCSNGCKYCYAQSKKIMRRQLTIENKDIPKERKWESVVRDFRNGYRKSGGKGRIMFPSTHDITEDMLGYCLKTLLFMLQYDSKVKILIVSKPRLSCIKTLCEELAEYKDRILFRFTIGSAKEAVLRFWEPGASSYAERIECLKYAYRNGFQTSLSCEPMLDDRVDAVIKDAYEYVTDAIWLGSGNQMVSRLEWNGYSDNLHMKKLKEHAEINAECKIKKLYAKWGTDPKIKWKETLKKILGLEISKEKGTDI